jgi:hypothetical protein
LTKYAIDIRSKQGAHPKTRAVRADTDQVDFVLLSIIQDFAIGMALSHYRPDVAPKMDLGRYRSL